MPRPLGVGAIALVIALSCAAPASAQLLPPIFAPPGGGDGDGDGGSSLPVESPPSDSLAYGANPSRTGVAAEERIAGPMRRGWTRRFAGPTNHPLVVGELVLVNVGAGETGPYGSKVVALDEDSGRTRWQARTPGTYFSAPIAADSERVVSVNFDGHVRAFDLDDGDPLWNSPLPNARVDSSPVVDGGAVYVWAWSSSSGSGTLHALSALDGATLWSTRVEIDAGNGNLAIDNERVYVADECGGAAAIRRSDGAPVWLREAGPAHLTCFGVPALVADGRVFSNKGRTYSAVDGSDTGEVSNQRASAVRGGHAYVNSNSLQAFSIADGERQWRRAYGRRSQTLEPVIAGETIFVASERFLHGYAAASGKPLSTTHLPPPGHVGVGGITPGIAAGAGKLFIARGTGVFAVRPVLRPEPDDLAIGASAFDVAVGKRISIVGIAGADLRDEGRRMKLLADPFPFRGLKRSARERTLADGSAYFRARLRRNTRFAVRDSNTNTRSRSFTAYAYPRIGFDFDPVSPQYVVARIAVKDVPSRVLSGRRVAIYLNRHGSARLKKLGEAPLRVTGRRRAIGAIRFRRLARVGRRDTLVACVPGLARHGYGRNAGLGRQCGDPRTHLRSKAAAGEPGPGPVRAPARALR